MNSRPPSAGSQGSLASVGSHDSSLSWLLSLEHLKSDGADLHQQGLQDSVLIEGKRGGKAGLTNAPLSRSSGDGGGKKSLLMDVNLRHNNSVVGEKRVQPHLPGLRPSSKSAGSPYLRKPLPVDLQMEIENQLIAKGRLPKNGKVDKFGAVTVAKTNDRESRKARLHSAVDGKSRKKSIVDMLHSYRDTQQRIHRRENRGVSHLIHKRELSDQIGVLLADEARRERSSIFANDDQIWRIPKAHDNIFVKEVDATTNNAAIVMEKRKEWVSLLKSEPMKSVTNYKVDNTFDPIYRIMLEESRTSVAKLESGLEKLMANNLKYVQMSESLCSEEWIVFRVVFFLFLRHHDMMGIVACDTRPSPIDAENSMELSRCHSTLNKGNYQYSSRHAPTTNEIEKDTLSNLREATRVLLNHSSVSPVLFSWNSMRILLDYPSAFLSSLKHIERGHEGPSDIMSQSENIDSSVAHIEMAYSLRGVFPSYWKSGLFYRSFSEEDYKSLTLLCSTSLLHPSYTAKSSPTTSYLCSWARRVICGLYLSRASTIHLHRCRLDRDKTRHLHLAGITPRAGTESGTLTTPALDGDESKSLASSQLFEAIEYLKTPHNLHEKKDKLDNEDQQETRKTQFDVNRLSNKLLLDDSNESEVGNVKLTIILPVSESTIANQELLIEERIILAGMSVAQCSDNVNIITLGQNNQNVFDDGRQNRQKLRVREEEDHIRASTLSPLHIPFIDFAGKATQAGTSESKNDPSHGTKSVSLPYTKLVAAKSWKDTKGSMAMRTSTAEFDNRLRGLVDRVDGRGSNSRDSMIVIGNSFSQQDHDHIQDFVEKEMTLFQNVSLFIVPSTPASMLRAEDGLSSLYCTDVSYRKRLSNTVIILTASPEIDEVLCRVGSRLGKPGDNSLLFYWARTGNQANLDKEEIQEQGWGSNVVLEHEGGQDTSSTRKKTMLEAILAYNPTRVCFHAGPGEITNMVSTQIGQFGTKNFHDDVIARFLEEGVEVLLLYTQV